MISWPFAIFNNNDAGGGNSIVCCSYWKIFPSMVKDCHHIKVPTWSFRLILLVSFFWDFFDVLRLRTVFNITVSVSHVRFQQRNKRLRVFFTGFIQVCLAFLTMIILACSNQDSWLDKELMGLHSEKKVSSRTYLSYSNTMKARSRFVWCVHFFLFFFCLWDCAFMCRSVSNPLWPDTCPQAPCLTDESVSSRCLWGGLLYAFVPQRPLLCLLPHTEERINPKLPQWMGLATVPSTMSSNSEWKEEKDVWCRGLAILCFLLNYFLYEFKKGKKITFDHFFPFVNFISFLVVMSHLLSFMRCIVCHSRLHTGACALTAIVQYQYCDGWGATRLHISSECKDNWKEGSVTNLTPKSLQGIPFKKKQNRHLTQQSSSRTRVNSIKQRVFPHRTKENAPAEVVNILGCEIKCALKSSRDFD